MAGRISLRQLRVMVDHLPPDNPESRAIRGPWGDRERLLWDISAQLRDLTAGYYAAHGSSLGARPYLPLPALTEYQQAVIDQEAAEQHSVRLDLRRVLDRPGASVGGE